MTSICLWDNSQHCDIEETTYPIRKLELPKKRGREAVIKSFRTLSSSTIGEMMEEEGNSILVWPNSFEECKSDLKDQYIFQISEKNGLTIDAVMTNNIVGFIGIGNTHIRIHSRFSSKNKKGVRSDYFLYHMLGKVMAINLFDLPTSTGTDMAFDFLLFFFPKLLKEAMSQGMYKKYVYHEYNDANVRGVIDINRHIRRNVPANGRIAYRTREFSYDNPMTQLIRHTIEFIRCKPFGKAVLHNDADTDAYVQQIIQATPSFVQQKRQTVINDNLRPVVHPYFTKYAALQKLCLSILRHEKLSYGQANNKIHGILIDAAWLWEEYIAKVLSERTGFKHYTRNNAFHLLRKEDKTFQPIIPDYLDLGDQSNKIVADAKYIPLHRYDHLDADRASAVYYKTIMYMYRFNTQKGFLFHPCSVTDVEEMEKKPTEFEHFKIDENKQTVSCEYDIVDRDCCHLHEVGMIVPSTDKYEEFSSSMDKIEKAFVQLIH